MKKSLFLSLSLLGLTTGAYEPFAIFLFGVVLLSLGQLIRKQKRSAHRNCKSALSYPANCSNETLLCQREVNHESLCLRVHA